MRQNYFPTIGETKMINRILCIFFISTFVWAECNEGEVELWDVCYNIEETTELDLNNFSYSQKISLTK